MRRLVVAASLIAAIAAAGVARGADDNAAEGRDSQSRFRERSANARKPPHAMSIDELRAYGRQIIGERPAPRTEPILGIFEGYSDVVRPSRFRTVNYWVGMVEDHVVMVLAGAQGEYAPSPGTGSVFVHVVNAKEHSVVQDIVASPGSGPLRIAAVAGDVLTLVDTTKPGVPRFFDVRARRFR
ncbi:MAG TPA: hypothetical protein VFB78_14750 [Acidimicrobiales bacterium]|nr:hypothetical protein [Acidimicrobiales bacterium]